MNKGFTFLELLFVVLIIGILASVSVLSYANIRNDSYDSRRKVDLEEVRAALEQYRSIEDAYPTPTGTYGLPFGSGSLTEGSNTYMQSIPGDPQSPAYRYYYTTSGDDYTLASELITPESTACASPPGGNSCGAGHACNYCLGSYGKK